MTVDTLFNNARYQLNDENKVSYSDAQLLVYLNQINKYVYSTVIDHESNLTLTLLDITLTDGEVTLPLDFTIESAVKDENDRILNAVSPIQTPTSAEYKILGSTIYSDNDTITILYHSMPNDYTATTETLLIPKYFDNLYSEMLIFLTFNSDEYDTSVEQALVSRFESNVLNLVGKRGNTNPIAPMPFKV